MKKFNTLQELWSFALFCPLCQDITREVIVAGGPSNVIEVKSQKKTNEILKIQCSAKLARQSYNIAYYIDCIKNTFTVSITEAQVQDPPVKGTSSPTFTLSLISDCRICGNTSMNSEDIEIDLLTKKVSNFEVCMEGIYLLNQKNKYHLTLNHKAQELILSKCHEDDDGSIIDDNKTISFPLTHFDFSKPKKVLNRIRTLLVFS